MNKYIFVLGVIVSLITISCSTSKQLSRKQLNELDTALVGVWIGDETGQQLKDIKREWEMVRNEDGTFILYFKTYYPTYTYEHEETGYWWTKNGIFYEYHTGYHTDVYKYEILNENEVKFIAIKSKSYFEGKGTYIFVDKRKTEK